MPDTRREREVIESFCKRMSTLFRANWHPTKFPEPPGIDAELDCGGVKTAVDHTWLDSFEDYRLSNVRLGSLATALEQIIRLPDKTSSVKLFFPAKGIPRVREEDLKSQWVPQIESFIHTLPFDEKPKELSLSKPKCTVWLTRTVEHKYPGLRVARLLHSGAKLELKENLQRIITSKNLQLASSKRDGWATTLIIESVDIATVNDGLIAEQFSLAAKIGKHDSLDSVFLFDDPQRDSNFFVFPLKFKGVIPPPWLWMDEFRQAQGALLGWWTDRGLPYIDENGPIPRREFTL